MITDKLIIKHVNTLIVDVVKINTFKQFNVFDFYYIDLNQCDVVY